MNKQISKQIDSQIDQLIAEGKNPHIIQMDSNTLSALFEEPIGHDIMNYSYNGYEIIYPLDNSAVELKVLSSHV